MKENEKGEGDERCVGLGVWGLVCAALCVIVCVRRA